ncbi:hypothetical protein Vretimale_17370, partial [Volvox reticuliferus]
LPDCGGVAVRALSSVISCLRLSSCLSPNLSRRWDATAATATDRYPGSSQAAAAAANAPLPTPSPARVAAVVAPAAIASPPLLRPSSPLSGLHKLVVAFETSRRLHATAIRRSGTRRHKGRGRPRGRLRGSQKEGTTDPWVVRSPHTAGKTPRGVRHRISGRKGILKSERVETHTLEGGDIQTI